MEETVVCEMCEGLGIVANFYHDTDSYQILWDEDVPCKCQKIEKDEENLRDN